MQLNSLVIASCAVFVVLLCDATRAQPRNLTELIQEIQWNMDRTSNPCEDFYEFACGGFTKTHPVPANATVDYLDWPTYHAVINDTLRTIKRVVEQPWPVVNDFYRSCYRSKEEIERSANDTYRTWTRFINSSSLSTGAEIWDVVARLSIFDPFFDVSSEEAYDFSENVTFRGPYISASNTFEGVDWNDATEIAELLKFAETAFSNDTKLVAAEKAESALRVARYVSGFAKEFPFQRPIVTVANATRITDIDWKSYFQTVGANLRSDEKIGFSSFDYFGNLTKYVSNLPEQTLKNYLQLLVFIQISENQEVVLCYTGEGNCNGRLNLPGYPDISHSDKCAYFVGSMLQDLVDFIITEETDSVSIAAVERVASALKEATNASLSSLKWITSAQDLKIASKKIQNELVFVGSKKSNRYSTVDTQPENIFENIIELLLGLQGQRIRDSYKELNSSDFLAYLSLDVDYNYLVNLVYVPTTLIDSEVFSASWPKLFQFAKLGGLIGRQVVHAIDEMGQNEYNPLFSVNSTKAYQTVEKCVAQVWDNYTIGNLTFNTVNNLEQDIVDIAGLKNSYNAYQAYIARYGKEFPDGAIIPGYSTNQVFFLVSAQLSCSVQSKEFLESQIAQSRYAPNKIRTNGAVSQSVEFAKAFNCPVNAPMNPARKCNIF